MRRDRVDRIGRMTFQAGKRFRLAALFCAVAFFFLMSLQTASGQVESELGGGSLADRGASLPTAEQWLRTLSLADYNTRIVVFGAAMLGFASGLIGSFTLLRKRALMGDALSHATLPGIALAFVLMTVTGRDGKSLPALLIGAAISGAAGVGAILLIRNLTRLKEDAALGIVLSVFFGAGVAILGVVQQMEAGHAAGLESFIYGKTASMTATDARLIGGAALVASIVCLLLFKEFKLLCFDEGFAGARGFPVVALDMALMSLVVLVTIIGLQAVGLVLMIAMLTVPAAAARFWTERMSWMTIVSATFGAVSAMTGAAVSALFPRLPSGAMIVIVAAVFFATSMLFGKSRGVLPTLSQQWKLERRVRRQHFLRAMFELLEAQGQPLASDAKNLSAPVAIASLLPMRSWTERRLFRQVRDAENRGLVFHEGDYVRLTPLGCREAAHVAHQHRLWEQYLITYADVAAGNVDRDADAIEHVLDAEMVAELESLLQQRKASAVLASPHPVFDSDPMRASGRQPAE